MHECLTHIIEFLVQAGHVALLVVVALGDDADVLLGEVHRVPLPRRVAAETVDAAKDETHGEGREDDQDIGTAQRRFVHGLALDWVSKEK